MRWSWLPLISICCALALPPAARADLINGGFEAYPQAAGSYSTYTDTDYDGWRTTEPDHQIEVWGTGFQGVAAYQGNSFAEINANSVSTLYQDISGIPAGALLSFSFAHRGRMGTDVMRMVLTDLGTNLRRRRDDTELYRGEYSDGNTAWGTYSSTGLPAIVSLGNVLRLSFISVNAAGGSDSVGNFLDGVSVSFNDGYAVSVPEPGALGLLMPAFAALVLMRRRAV